MPSPTSTTARLEARISNDLHALLKRAAEIQGRTMTDFVVSAVQDAAQHAIEQAEVMRLSVADQACFVKAMLSPPKPSAALKRAVAQRRLYNLCLYVGPQRRNARRTGLALQQARDALGHKALLPAPDCGFTGATALHDLERAAAVGGQ